MSLQDFIQMASFEHFDLYGTLSYCRKCSEECQNEAMSEIDETKVVIRRNAAFMKAAYPLGEYIKALPLSVEQNDQLIKLIGAQVNAAEKSGCEFGLDIGLKITHSQEKG